MAKNYEYILMDLDGTITDPMEGITRCVQYALKHLGIEVNNLEELCCFIGPPLMDSFQEYYGLTELQAIEAIAKYHERFATIGMYENFVYPGMVELLSTLQKNGKKLMVASSKPEEFVRKILEHFQLISFFDFVGGATFDRVRSHKEEVIDYVLKSNRIQDLSTIVMVGDRKYDVFGAQCAGIDSIGVTYGYGSREELEEAGTTYLVDQVEELQQLLCPQMDRICK